MDKKDTYNTAVSVRMEDDLRTALEMLAAQDHRPLANYIRVVLERHAKEQGALNPETETAHV